MEKYKLCIMVIVVLIVGLLILGSTFMNGLEQINYLQNELDNKVCDTCSNGELLELKSEIISLQEEAKYTKEEMEKAREEETELQTVFDKIANDFYNCYMANFCLYYPKSCEEYEEDDWTAEENHIYYSDECDKADRDWDLYGEYYDREK